MKSDRVLIIYSFLACAFLMAVGIFSARSSGQLLASFIYLPLVFFFGTKIFHWLLAKTVTRVVVQNKVLPGPASNNAQVVSSPTDPESDEEGVTDKDKRLFLKLIGTTGISLLLLALFSRRARDTFLGGGVAAGPDVVGIKDTTGNQIDPAQQGPTDGYEISEIDDEGTPVHFGYVKKTGAWYIMQYNNGNFRYTKGDKNFSANWSKRTELTYGYFNDIFS